MGQALCMDMREVDGALDLRALPLEIVLRILEYLDPGTLCRISLVNSQWRRVANLDLIWKRQCIRRVAGLDPGAAARLQLKWKQVFIMIQSFIYCFNEYGDKGLNMLLEMNLINNNASSLAIFLDQTRNLNKAQIGRVLADPSRREIMLAFVQMQPVRNVFLGEALRDFLSKFDLPRRQPISQFGIIEKFAEYYWVCNRDRLSFSKESSVLLFFSLMMLSMDLSSPHIKNKMTKREFIRNLRNTPSFVGVTTDYLGLLYDFVFLQGLVKQQSSQQPSSHGGSGSSSSGGSSSGNSSSNVSGGSRVCHTFVNHISKSPTSRGGHRASWEATPRLLTVPLLL